MKKLLTLLLFAVAITWGATSCKKDYNCNCAATPNGLPAQVIPIPNSSKSSAQEACDLAQTQRQSVHASATCELE